MLENPTVVHVTVTLSAGVRFEHASTALADGANGMDKPMGTMTNAVVRESSFFNTR